MTTMIHPNENGRKRPNLGEQINRLDSMLDGLSEGLNDAVADAVKVAVGDAMRQAVQSVLTEVLTNPEIIARLHPAMAQPVARRISLRERLSNLCGGIRTCLVGLRAACGEMLYTAKTLITNDWRCTIEHLATLWRHVQMLRPFKYQILLALAIGTLIGVGVWHAGPWFGAVTSGIGGFATALSVQAGLWLRKLFAGDVKQMA